MALVQLQYLQIDLHVVTHVNCTAVGDLLQVGLHIAQGGRFSYHGVRDTVDLHLPPLILITDWL